MNLRYLGDALDHWKGALFEFLGREKLLVDLAVDPMATDASNWTSADFELFARLLHISDAQILRHASPIAARAAYFAEITHQGDLFLDPDTGIDTGSGSPIDNYIKASEIAQMLSRPKGRVVAVYQHIRAQKTHLRVDACVQEVASAAGRIAWCSYESGTVAMLFFSDDVERTRSIANGFGRLLGRHSQGRVRSSSNESAA